MAASKPSDLSDSTNNLAVAVAQGLDGLPVGKDDRLCVAFSGGLDSVVLLDLLTWHRAGYGYRLSACHVHHGLSPNADDWAAFCQRFCEARGIALNTVHLAPLETAGRGVEAAAREARYQALIRQEADVIALAHHLDDQAETVLLQLFRGTGLSGLAAMSTQSLWTEGSHRRLFWRPLLDQPRTVLHQWAIERGLDWVEDESNGDPSYRRNAIRHQILPAIKAHWPGCVEAMGRTARHCREALSLIDDLAKIDAVTAVTADGLLDLEVWQGFDQHRAANLLRYWLRQRRISMPSEARFDELARQLHGLSRQSTGQLQFGRARLGWYRQKLYSLPAVAVDPFSVVWQGEEIIEWPPLGRQIRFRRTVGYGIRESVLASTTVELVTGYGQEQKIKLAGRTLTQRFKQVFQEKGIPPWQRLGWPILLCDRQIAVIVGIGTASSMTAGSDEPGVVVDFVEAGPVREDISSQF